MITVCDYDPEAETIYCRTIDATGAGGFDLVFSGIPTVKQVIDRANATLAARVLGYNDDGHEHTGSYDGVPVKFSDERKKVSK